MRRKKESAHLYITFQVDVFRAKILRDHFVYGRIFCVKFCAAKLRIHFAHAKTLEHLEGKQRVCPYKPQNFVLACLLGRKFSFDLFCRFARLLGGNKKAIVIKRLLFYYLFFFGLLFFKFSKRFFNASFVSVSISCSSAYSFPSQWGTVSFLGS